MPASVRIPHETGIALITVLLIVSLAAIAATALAAVQQLAIRRSTLLLHHQQAKLYALGAEQWAAVILQRDLDNNRSDHLEEPWATTPATFPIEGGSISGSIQELQGRFNLNNLLARKSSNADGSPGAGDDQIQSDDGINRAQLEILQRLLESLDLDPNIAQAIADWIDPDQTARFPDGAEDSDYSNLTPAYLSANRPLVSLSELRLIRGIDRESYARLADHVYAVPVNDYAPPTPVNINTTTAPVLAAVASIELQRATEIIQNRPLSGYASVEDFLADAQLAIPSERFGVASQYFLVRAQARVGEARASINSLLQRAEPSSTGATSASLRILLRSFGRDE